MLSSLLLAALLATGEPAAPQARSATAAVPRTLAAISGEMSALLKAEATAKSLEERGAAVQQLTTLYGEIMRDERLETNDFLKNYRGELYNRLVRTRDDLKRKIAQEQRRLPRGTAHRAEAPATSPADEEALAFAKYCAAQSLATADRTSGSASLAFSRGGAAVYADYGQALVELIERTINPSFWDTNGGPGTIFYYAPLRCLVVNATGHLHEEIGGLLDGVRAAGN